MSQTNQVGNNRGSILDVILSNNKSSVGQNFQPSSIPIPTIELSNQQQTMNIKTNSNAVEQTEFTPTTSNNNNRRTNYACTNCRKAHKACSGERPCERCKKLGLDDSCKSTVRKKRILTKRYWIHHFLSNSPNNSQKEQMNMSDTFSSRQFSVHDQSTNDSMSNVSSLKTSPRSNTVINNNHLPIPCIQTINPMQSNNTMDTMEEEHHLNSHSNYHQKSERSIFSPRSPRNNRHRMLSMVSPRNPNSTANVTQFNFGGLDAYRLDNNNNTGFVSLPTTPRDAFTNNNYGNNYNNTTIPTNARSNSLSSSSSNSSSMDENASQIYLPPPSALLQMPIETQQVPPIMIQYEQKEQQPAFPSLYDIQHSLSSNNNLSSPNPYLLSSVSPRGTPSLQQNHHQQQHNYYNNNNNMNNMSNNNTFTSPRSDISPRSVSSLYSPRSDLSMESLSPRTISDSSSGTPRYTMHQVSPRTIDHPNYVHRRSMTSDSVFYGGNHNDSYHHQNNPNIISTLSDSNSNLNNHNFPIISNNGHSLSSNNNNGHYVHYRNNSCPTSLYSSNNNYNSNQTIFLGGNNNSNHINNNTNTHLNNNNHQNQRYPSNIETLVSPRIIEQQRNNGKMQSTNNMNHNSTFHYFEPSTNTFK
ncbi:hypothetical protein ABK040_003902 [Willaertia magna]